MRTKIRRAMRKINFKKTLLFIIGLSLILATVIGVASILRNPMKKVSLSAFSKGTLNSSGEYEVSQTQIYTKEMFECQGLEITQDFESTSSYEVFYYRADKTFVGSTGSLKGAYTKKGFENAKYARIVITPILEEGKEKIGVLQIRKYAKEIKISVLKEQNFVVKSVQLFEGIEKEYFSSPEAFEAGYTVIRNDSPFAMGNLTAFENQTVTKIGVPVSYIKDPTKDNVFTVYVIEGDGTTDFKRVEEIKLTIPANTFNNLDKVTFSDIASDDSTEVTVEYNSVYVGWYKVQEWYYFDVQISLETNQTLGYCAVNDTVAFAYNKDASVIDYKYATYNTVFDTPALLPSIWIYFDVWVME